MFTTRSLKTLGVLAAAGAVALPMSAQAHAAPSTAAAKKPWMSVSLSPSVTGMTMTYRYSEAGAQHFVRGDNGKLFKATESAGYQVYVDGKLIDGGDGLGGMSCSTTGLAPFKSTSRMTGKHTFTKPGKHTVKVVGTFCGDKGRNTVARTYTVVATAAPAKATLTAAGTYTPGKPLRLTGMCATSAATKAVVVGPRAMKATLLPAKGTKGLTGTITVPTALQGSWVRLAMTCSDGSRGTTVITKTGSKTPAPRA